MKGAKYLFLILIFPLLLSCGGSDDGPGDPEPTPAPSAATLVFPEDNSECTEGTLLSDTESEVIFQWNVAQNADSYTVNLRNLNTDDERQINANTNESAIRLNRGTPYSWSVVSKANGTAETAESTTWKFYNAGPGIENYSPFPADDPSPKSGASVNSGGLTLGWTGSDLDNDIVSYEVYFDVTNPPEMLAGTVTQTSFETTVTADTVYYWRVITIDSENNRSNSQIFQFRSN